MILLAVIYLLIGCGFAVSGFINPLTGYNTWADKAFAIAMIPLWLPMLVVVLGLKLYK